MPWPFELSQQPQPDPEPKARKRVSWSVYQPTDCPPQSKPSAKEVRFTSDTKKGSRSDSKSNSARSDKTRWPSPSRSIPAAKHGAPGLSSVKRDFQTKKPVVKPALKPSRPSEPLRPTKPVSRAPQATRPDAVLSIPVGGASYNGPPKARHQRPGYEWVSHEIRVKTNRKDWRREKWAK